MSLEDKVFERFRRRLPNRIDDDVIEYVIEQCIERLEFLGDDPYILLGDSIDVTIDRSWNGDIHVIQREDFPWGYTWIFDKRSGYLHTT